ncbi:hypothetical protein K9M06_03070 [Candidatus Bipolaricaulota bacterium]|nr:hypothetical protein [Candidatus Bipolaricaulota bacterium]
MKQNKTYLGLITGAILFSLLSMTPIVLGQSASDLPVYNQFKDASSGTFATGELIYINKGKKLGTESYKLSKTSSGGVKLTASGVVTPPIPIPFVKPKIKFDQTIQVSKELKPLSLELQYKGPLGIGNKKIKVTVNGDQVKVDRGGKKSEKTLRSTNPFFLGTNSSQAIVALLLVAKGGPEQMTEILSGSTGPGGGEEGQITRGVELKSIDTRRMKIKGNILDVDRFVYGELESKIEKAIYVKNGTFIAYQRLNAENPFYVYRSDLLGENFKL